MKKGGESRCRGVVVRAEVVIFSNVLTARRQICWTSDLSREFDSGYAFSISVTYISYNRPAL